MSKDMPSLVRALILGIPRHLHIAHSKVYIKQDRDHGIRCSLAVYVIRCGEASSPLKQIYPQAYRESCQPIHLKKCPYPYPTLCFPLHPQLSTSCRLTLRQIQARKGSPDLQGLNPQINIKQRRLDQSHLRHPWHHSSSSVRCTRS